MRNGAVSNSTYSFRIVDGAVPSKHQLPTRQASLLQSLAHNPIRFHHIGDALAQIEASNLSEIRLLQRSVPVARDERVQHLQVDVEVVRSQILIESIERLGGCWHHHHALERNAVRHKRRNRVTHKQVRLLNELPQEAPRHRLRTSFLPDQIGADLDVRSIDDLRSGVRRSNVRNETNALRIVANNHTPTRAVSKSGKRKEEREEASLTSGGTPRLRRERSSLTISDIVSCRSLEA